MPFRSARSMPPRRWSTPCGARNRTAGAGHHHHADRLGAGARAVGRAGTSTSYLPYDLPGAVAQLPRPFPAARLAIDDGNRDLAELCSAAVPRRADVIVNARLSERSLRGYRLLAPLMRARWHASSIIAAQSEADAARFIASSARAEARWSTPATSSTTAPCPTGLPDSRALHARSWNAGRSGSRRARIRTRRRWCCGASRLRARCPDVLLLWAPRHPERFRRGGRPAHGCRLARRDATADGWPGADDDVFVVDTLGELMSFYAGADVAFVGGSLQEDRWPQPAGTGGARHRRWYRPAPSTSPRSPAAGRGGCVAHRRRCRRGGARRWKSCWPMRRRASAAIAGARWSSRDAVRWPDAAADRAGIAGGATRWRLLDLAVLPPSSARTGSAEQGSALGAT